VRTPEEPGAAPGLTPQQLAEAERRLARYLAQRCNPASAYNAHRYWTRFVALQTIGPERSPLEQVQAFLGTVPASNQITARTVLKVALGPTVCDWSAVVLKSYRRNELRLSAGVLREEARVKVRAAARGPCERAMLELLWVLRRAEVAALCWRDLDVARGMITVLKGKGAKPSWTLLPPSTREALAAWFAAAGSPPDSAPVFAARRGCPYTPEGLGKRIQRLLRRAGVWTSGTGNCHRFRRSFATTYLKTNPADLTGLMRLMRHENIATTQRYVWYEPEDLAPRMAALEL
jgi:hypothetical protein